MSDGLYELFQQITFRGLNNLAQLESCSTLNVARYEAELKEFIRHYKNCRDTDVSVFQKNICAFEEYVDTLCVPQDIECTCTICNWTCPFCETQNIMARGDCVLHLRTMHDIIVCGFCKKVRK